MKVKILLFFIGFTIATIPGMATELFPSYGIGEQLTSQEKLVLPQEPTIQYGKTNKLIGDVNGDKLVGVADVTDLIDYLLGNPSENFVEENADVDRDGNISVADVSELIDMIKGTPNIELCTFLILTKTDGTTQEFKIDESSQIIIEKPNLKIKTYRLSFPVYHTIALDQIAHLSYEERVVEPNNPFGCNIMIDDDIETLNTLQP